MFRSLSEATSRYFCLAITFDGPRGSFMAVSGEPGVVEFLVKLDSEADNARQDLRLSFPDGCEYAIASQQVTFQTFEERSRFLDQLFLSGTSSFRAYDPLSGLALAEFVLPLTEAVLTDLAACVADLSVL